MPYSTTSFVPTLPPPDGGQPDLLILAGEHSGDQHAARMVADLQGLCPSLKIAALGGRQLEEAGAQLLYDLTQHAVVGLFEVLKNYGLFKKLFAEVLNWIAQYRPRHLCLVDYPGFNLRLAQRLYEEGISRKGGGEMGLYYYISPQVWAWKGKRRFKMARLLDALGVIFPFEVDCYQGTGLPVDFVGHPFAYSDYSLPLIYASSGPVLLLPGSRRLAVSRIFPLMTDAFGLLLGQRSQEQAVVLYPDSEIRHTLEAVLETRPHLRKPITLVPFAEKVEGKAVLTSSGTMSLLCALAGIPGAIAYRAHPLTYLLGRMLVQVPHLGIANLLLPEPIYPEYIQGHATPQHLCKVLQESMDSSEKVFLAKTGAQQLYKMLSSPQETSAAIWLMKLMERQHS